MLKLTSFILLVTLLAFAECGSKDQWKKRTIYQVLTDRFWRSDGSTQNCGDYHTYCGGSWKGLEDKLDYIQGMGFDAIWISPVPKNTPKGYHGYWQQDFYQVNPHFGDEGSLKSLINAMHKRGMWVMVDVVGNHVGYVPGGFDFSIINPFNKAEHYHKYCQIHGSDFQHNQWRVEHCRLANLPDLNQENQWVRKTLKSWIHDLVQKYSIDGLRIDTVPEVEKPFWKEFTDSAGVFTIGEVFDGRINYVAGYQGKVSATLNYPMFFTLANVYAGSSSMYQIRNELKAINSGFPDPASLGLFLDNHDNPRFLSRNGNVHRLRNGLSYILFANGIPIVYYGTEQYFKGSHDPYNREPLWTSMNPNSKLYQFISTLVKYRKKMQVWNYKHIERYVADHFYAWSRGKTFIATTNNDGNETHTITYHPYQNGDVICNILYPKKDCVTIKDKKFTVFLESGQTKVYVPQNKL